MFTTSEAAKQVNTVAIGAFKIINMGQDNCQYFPGATAMFAVGGVLYDTVFTGAGDNAKDAYNNALDQIADSDYEYASAGFPSNPAGITKRDKVSAKDLRESEGEWQCYVAVYIKHA